MRTLRFYFDYLSPYAYLAWTQIHTLGVEVAPHPVLFAALLDANGARGPAEVPARRRYIIRDLARLAYYLAHGDVVSAEMIETWEHLPAQAVRTRANG